MVPSNIASAGVCELHEVHLPWTIAHRLDAAVAGQRLAVRPQAPASP
jgi:hypothetical protein